MPKLNEVVSLENIHNNTVELFQVKKVAKRYIYLISYQYGSDGWWRTNKDCPIYVERCAKPTFK